MTRKRNRRAIVNLKREGGVGTKKKKKKRDCGSLTRLEHRRVCNYRRRTSTWGARQPAKRGPGTLGISERTKKLTKKSKDQLVLLLREERWKAVGG